MRIITGLRISAAAAGAVGALAILPVGANAAFDTAFGAQCQGATSIAGRGASFQRQAQLAWGAQQLAPDPANAEANGFGYANTLAGGCASFAVGGANKVTFEPKGSGDGRKAMGASTVQASLPGATPVVAREAGIRDTTIQFGAADEPPTTAQLAAANEGPTTDATDNASLLTVPVAQSSVAVVVKLPAGCTVPFAQHQISRTTLAGAFGGKAQFDTWGEVFTSLTGDCAAAPLKRVVRFDSSGTTFAFKNYLRDIDPTSFPTTLGNTVWPNDSGATAVEKSDANGAGALLDKLSGLSGGGIGYADLAASRNRGYDTNVAAGAPDSSDTTFWLNVERRDGVYQSPALADTKGTTNTGSNCRNTAYTDAALGRLPTATESWSNVNSNASTADYSLCALTYALVWADMAKANVNRAATAPAYTQAQARATKDYLGYMVNVAGGQAALAPNGYQGLPSVNNADGTAASGSVLAAAQTAQKSIVWNQSTQTTPPGGGGGDTGGGNNGGGNTPPPTVTTPAPTPTTPAPAPTTPAPATKPTPAPAPKPAAAKVTVSKAVGAKGRVITLTVSPSAAGKVSVSATALSGKTKVTVGKASASAKKSGALKLTIKPGAKGKAALKAGKTVKVTFKVTFTAASGAKTTVTKTIKVKIKR